MPIVIIFFIACLSIILFTLKLGISPMPTPKKARRKILELLPTECPDVLFELGSGWGTLAFPLSKFYPKCEVIGFEASPIPWIISLVLQKVFFRFQNLKFFRKNFFDVSLKEAGLIVCYLYPGAMKKLKDKFAKELTSGTLIISYTFSIPGWTPLMECEVDDLYRSKIYLYKV